MCGSRGSSGKSGKLPQVMAVESASVGTSRLRKKKKPGGTEYRTTNTFKFPANIGLLQICHCWCVCCVLCAPTRKYNAGEDAWGILRMKFTQFIQ